MSRIGNLLRALFSGGPRCPWCGVPSPHRMPHPKTCPWYPFNPSMSPATYRATMPYFDGWKMREPTSAD